MLNGFSSLGLAQFIYVAVAFATNIYGAILVWKRGRAYGPTKPWVGLLFIASAGAVLAFQNYLGANIYVLLSLPIIYIMARFGIEAHFRKLKSGGLAAYDPKAMGIIGISTNIVGVTLWSFSIATAHCQ